MLVDCRVRFDSSHFAGKNLVVNVFQPAESFSRVSGHVHLHVGEERGQHPRKVEVPEPSSHL